jgi:flagellar basal-body rod modification protein FlgD
MSIADPISALAAQSSAANAANAKPKDQLGQDSFLRLMIAQFQNQDPTKPKDPSEFLGQLAQFSTVSGIQDMQTSLSTLADSLRSAQVLDGSALVGRQILTAQDTINYAGTGLVTGAVDVPEGAATVDFTIKDSVGQLIRKVTVPATQGTMDFAWDGLNERGEQVDAGKYTLSAGANVGGANESLPVLLNSRVSSVTIDPASHQLTLNTSNLGPITLSNVRRVM